MAASTLRSLLPMRAGDIAAVSALVAEIVERLHARGVVHGAIGVDDVLVRRTEGGTFEVGLTAPTGRGTERDDVAAMGSMITAALAMSRRLFPADDGRARFLADVASTARRTAIDGTVAAGDVRDALAAASRREGAGHHGVNPAPGSRRWAGRLVLLAWLGLLLATVAWVPRVAQQVSPPPLLGGAASIREWLASRDEAMVIVGVLRLTVHGCALYLLASTLVACAMQLLPSRAAHRLPLLDRLTATPVRRVVNAAFSVGLTVGALSSLTPKSAPTEPVPVLRMPTTSTAPFTTATAEPPATVHTPEALDPIVTADASPAAWTVDAGDHFWGIAERLLSAAHGRPADDVEIAPYWRLLVEVNRDRLVDPDNPDLLFEGQELRVPPLSVPPETPAI